MTRDASLMANYQTGGYFTRLEPGTRPALIVIDFVKAYLLEDSPLYGGEGIRKARLGAIELLSAARAALIPIFHTKLGYDRDGCNGGVFIRKVPALRAFTAGSEYPERGEFADDLHPNPGETVITKQYASAFFATPLASALTAARIDTLLIAGVSTSGCVRATGVDCIQHGFIPVVVRDAVGDRAAGPHEANLFDLQAKYAEVVGLPEALAYLGHIGSTASRA
jgi:maleamate amidohydrolase